MKALKMLALAAAVALGAAMPALAQSQAQAPAQKVRIATEGAYAPFNFAGPDGKLTGFDVEIAQALCAKAKLSCDIVAQDWDGIIPGLIAKKYDAIVASMSMTDERRKRVDFTTKYYQTPARFIAKKGAALKTDTDGLKGKTVGVQRATIHAKYLEDNFGKVLKEVKQYDTQENANLDLVAGRLDAVLADSIALLEGFLKTPEGAPFEFVGPELTDRKWFGDGAGIAVRKGDKKLKDALDKAIVAIRADGTYKKINDKYFPFDIFGK